MSLDLHQIARKWQRRWKVEKIFESDANDKPKFFVTFPYPYVNGYAHIGHSYTCMRVEAFARYKRMRGFNVLFPQGFHVTGTPIFSAAQKVKENDEGQINALKLMGFSEKELPEFSEPLHWIKTFSQAWEQDLQTFGFCIDWRRTFITTDLNARYSKFIKWQFRTLKKKKLVVKGSHPVVWSKKLGMPVGDHDRSEGEGETPQEMVVLKFKVDDFILPCATYRPETVYGVTNIWINPDIEYIEAGVDGESWILTKECLEKLELQKHVVKEKSTISGSEFIGKKVINPVTGDSVFVLPASFVHADVGTGVVMCVPAHAPFDWTALSDIQKDPSKFGVPEEVKELTPICIMTSKGYGDNPAKEVCEKLGVKSQEDKDKLEQATNEVYKAEFHTGRTSEKMGEFSGKSIKEVKPLITDKLIKEKKAMVLYELMNPVVSRSGDRCVVNIVDDQWFIKYGDADWKAKAMKCLEQIKLYPDKTRSQFEYVIDWLNDWACTREFGLGTTLPWDTKWKIESLSDSTIYMAYYTICHLLKKVPLGKIDDKLFDYIFLGEGDSSAIDIEASLLNQMKQEFEYWYPLDFRNSGKDLVQNHLSFFIFNHAAIFPEQYWPKGIGVNGYVNIQKQKMSKSKGLFMTMREALKEYSPDITRITILSTGEEVNDVDWDLDLAATMRAKLEQWYNFTLAFYSEREVSDDSMTSIDTWMLHQLHSAIRDATEAMENTLFRSAMMRGFFDIQRHLKWYMKRKSGQKKETAAQEVYEAQTGKAPEKMSKPHPVVLKEVIEAQTLMLAPFVPHLCEEIWQKLEKPQLITNEKWPSFDESKINETIIQSEAVIQQVMDDIQHVLKLAKIDKPKNIKLFIADDWKAELFKKIKVQLQNTHNPGDIIKALIPEFKDHGKDVSQIIPRIVKDPSKLPLHIMHQEVELEFLNDAKDFLENEYGCFIHIIKAQDSGEQKAKQAMPGKPALLVE